MNFKISGIEFDETLQPVKVNPMNSQIFNIENMDKAFQYYNNDMALVASDIELDKNSFFNLLALESTVDYRTRGFGTLRLVVWKYDGNETIYRTEVVMPKNAQV